MTPKEATAESEAAAARKDNEVNDVDDDADEGDDDSGDGSGEAPCSCAGDLFNCEADFDDNQPAAQECFDHCLEITGTDIHQLDNDDDQIACENE